MIDSPGKAMRLLSRLDAALPVLAAPTPELAAHLEQQSPGARLPERCRITRVDYAGDEGGIMCWLSLGEAQPRVVTSITHLRFDARHPLAREIASYQKQRVRRLHGPALSDRDLEEALSLLRAFASAMRATPGKSRAPAAARRKARAAS